MFAEPPMAPVLPLVVEQPRIWRGRDPLVAIGVLIASLVLILGIGAAVVIGLDLSTTSEDFVFAALGIAFELAFAGWVLWLARRRGISFVALGFRRPDRWGPLGIAVVGAYAAMFAWGLFITLLDGLGVDTGWIEGSNEIPVGKGMDRFPLIGLLLLFGLAVVVIAPLAEEVFFRGLLFRAFDGMWAGWLAILVSGFAFGLFHLNLSVLIPFSVIGMLFAWSFKASGSLWITVLAHFIFNSVSFIVTVIRIFT